MFIAGPLLSIDKGDIHDVDTGTETHESVSCRYEVSLLPPLLVDAWARTPASLNPVNDTGAMQTW